jgi:hypothetical protein
MNNDDRVSTFRGCACRGAAGVCKAEAIALMVWLIEPGFSSGG